MGERSIRNRSASRMQLKLTNASRVLFGFPRWLVSISAGFVIGIASDLVLPKLKRVLGATVGIIYGILTGDDPGPKMAAIWRTFVGFLQNPDGIFLLGILASIFAVFGLIAVGAFDALEENVHRQLSAKGLSSAWLSEVLQGDKGYLRVKDLILAAEREIFVLSHFIPKGYTLETTTSRGSYLEGIEELVRERFARPRSAPFSYRRIVQCHDGLPFSDSQFEWPAHELALDPGTLVHCQRILAAQELEDDDPHLSTHIEFYVSKLIPSFPSVVIIDDRYLAFALASLPQSAHAADADVRKTSRWRKLLRNATAGVQKGDASPATAKVTHQGLTDTGKLWIAGVLLIEDPDGSTVQGFKKMFEQFLIHAVPLRVIK